ncbi:unnamed protein product [Cuscuta campestris]|uniref:Uncharacterized protein n=1 Tax=Cuscuta campestris TaxID=132261 RepID=A0A484K7L1_9ASTE|nr:unnamed protein product [Cuscuta campestris]
MLFESSNPTIAYTTTKIASQIITRVCPLFPESAMASHKSLPVVTRHDEEEDDSGVWWFTLRVDWEN